MKRYLPLILSLSFLIATACKKKETTPKSPNPANSNSFTLKKDGVPYSAGQILITSSETSEYIGITAHLNAVQQNIQSYSMNLNKHIQPGTYDETNSPISLSDICAFVHIYNELQVFYMDDGKITILTNDTVAKKIEFNFKLNLLETTGPESVSITEGHAKISY